MTILGYTLLGILVLGFFYIVWKIAPAKSRLLVLQENTHFPTVSGYNLKREEYTLPRDFAGDLNLVIVPFKRQQQLEVDTWIPTVQGLEQSHPGFTYYELPAIYEMPILSRTFLNEGMRAGIPDSTARERTITLYIDKSSFKSALAIPNENDIYLFLVDREGNILWRTEGPFSEEKAEDLLKYIKK